jgi:hypothetical protein
MRARFFAACIATAMLCASPAFAQKARDPREVQAQKSCLSGKVEEGIALLAELYAETRNTNVIYNQARCYEQNARYANAINSFREYLRVARNITADEKAEVDRHMSECRSLQAEEERKAASDEPPAPPARVAAPTPASAAAGATPAALDFSAQAAPPGGESGSRPIYKTWWFWTGAAVVVVAGAVTAFFLANRSTDACDGIGLTCRGVK